MQLKVPADLKYYYKSEINNFWELYNSADLMHSWRALERSHIIGQSYPFEHTYSHWLMLKFGFKIKDLKEIIGQIPRLLVGGVKSFVGAIPVGNTGGTNVSALQSMPIPEDIRVILEDHKPTPHV